MAGAYVYAILVDGVVRYIGKGTGHRVKDHARIARSLARRRGAGESVRSTLFYNKLSKAWLDGAEIHEVILAAGLNDAEAFEIEVREIAARSGLWNLHPGGEGASSSVSKALWKDPSYRQKMKAVQNDPSLRARTNHAISSSLKVVSAKPAYRERLSRAQRASWANEESRFRRVEKFREAQADPTGPKARILSALVDGPLTLDELAGRIPEIGRKAIVQAVHKLKIQNRVSKSGGKYDGRFHLTNVVRLAG